MCNCMTADIFDPLKTIWVNYWCLPAQVQIGLQQSLLQPSPCLQPTGPSVWPWRNWPPGLGIGVSVCRGKHTRINEMAWVCACVSLSIFIIANLSSCHSSNLVSGSSSLQEYPIFTAVSTLRKSKGERKRGGKDRDHSETLFTLKMAPFPPPATVCNNTFFVPSQYPYFNPSLLKQSNSLRNALLKPVLYRCHSQELQNMEVNLCLQHFY